MAAAVNASGMGATCIDFAPPPATARELLMRPGLRIPGGFLPPRKEPDETILYRLTCWSNYRHDTSPQWLAQRDHRVSSVKDLECWGGNTLIVRDGKCHTERGQIDAFDTDTEDIVAKASGEQGAEEIVHAKYSIGGDGGHSWTRQQLPSVKIHGASSDCSWAVSDVMPITDSPDIRKNCTILSRHGTTLDIPREPSLVRVYLQDPYTLDYRYCDWWINYYVGQRVCNRISHLDRVFLASDAVHTDTPKGGHGINVSQQDAYNLARNFGRDSPWPAASFCAVDLRVQAQAHRSGTGRA